MCSFVHSEITGPESYSSTNSPSFIFSFERMQSLDRANVESRASQLPGFSTVAYEEIPARRQTPALPINRLSSCILISLAHLAFSSLQIRFCDILSYNVFAV